MTSMGLHHGLIKSIAAYPLDSNGALQSIDGQDQVYLQHQPAFSYQTSSTANLMTMTTEQFREAIESAYAEGYADGWNDREEANDVDPGG